MTTSWPKARRQAFALVIAMAMVTLLISIAAAVAVVSCCGSTRATWRAAELDHLLAVESVLVLLPELQPLADRRARDGKDEVIQLAVGRSEVFVTLREHRPRLLFGPGRSLVDKGDLITLANDHGLSAEGVTLRPILRAEMDHELPEFVWFDQLIQAQLPDDIFPWLTAELTEAGGVRLARKRTYWSQLLSFWPRERVSHTAAICTRIDGDTRRWIAFVNLAKRGMTVHYCAEIP